MCNGSTLSLWAASLSMLLWITALLSSVGAISLSDEQSPPILVLGSGGLIGRPLVKALESEGYKVLQVTGRDDLDLRIEGALQGRFDGVELSFVFFLAWDVGGSKYIFGSEISQASQIRSNTALLLNTMSWLEERQLPFLYTGSAMELAPDCRATLPAYAEGKRLGTAWALRLPTARTVRFWNVYGPVDDASERSRRGMAHVVTDWVHKCLDPTADAGTSSTVYVHARSDGYEERQMMFSGDASKLLVRAMQNYEALAHDDPIDLTSGEWISLRQLASTIEETLDILREQDSSIPSCKIVFPALPAEVTKNGEPELDSSAAMLNRNEGSGEKDGSFTTLKDGIRITIEEYWASEQGAVLEHAKRAGKKMETTSNPQMMPSRKEADMATPKPMLVSEVWSLTERAQAHVGAGEIHVAEKMILETLKNVTASGLTSVDPNDNEQGEDPALAHSALYNDMGVILLRLDRLEEARMCFVTALWINPFNPSAHSNIDYLQGRALAVQRSPALGNAYLVTPTHLKETALKTASVTRSPVYKPDAIRLLALAIMQSSTAGFSACTLLSEDFAVLVQMTLTQIPIGSYTSDYKELFMCGLHHIRAAHGRQLPPFKNWSLYRWYEAHLDNLRGRSSRDGRGKYFDASYEGCEKKFASALFPLDANATTAKSGTAASTSGFASIVLEARSMVRMGLKQEALELLEGVLADSNPDQEGGFLAHDAVLAEEVAALRLLRGRTEYSRNHGATSTTKVTECVNRDIVVHHASLASTPGAATSAADVDGQIALHIAERAKARAEGGHDDMYLVAVVNTNIGLGNRLLSLVGAFALALATRRTLLVQWPEEYRYDMPPSSLEDLLDLPPELAVFYDPVTLSRSLGIPLKDFPSSSSIFELFQDQEEHGVDLMAFNFLACDDLPTTRGGHAKFLHLHTNQEISAILRYNRHLPWAVQGDAFSRLARVLIRPSHRVQVAGEAWLRDVTGMEKSAHGDDRNYNYLSVHIRVGIAGHDVVGGRVITADEVDQNRNNTLHGAVKATGLVLRQLQKQRSPQGTYNDTFTSFVFVATDDTKVRLAAVQMIQEQLGIKAAAYDDKLLPENLRLGSGLPLVAADFFLLSAGQNILRREFSTFSMVAGAVGGLVPYLFVPCGSGHQQHRQGERQGNDDYFTVVRERHSSGRLGTNFDNLSRSPAVCYGEAGALSRQMLEDGFLYPSCSEFAQLHDVEVTGENSKSEESAIEGIVTTTVESPSPKETFTIHQVLLYPRVSTVHLCTLESAVRALLGHDWMERKEGLVQFLFILWVQQDVKQFEAEHGTMLELLRSDIIRSLEYLHNQASHVVVEIRIEVRGGSSVFNDVISGTAMEDFYATHTSDSELGKFAQQNRADAFRLAVVYKYGGLYMDADIIALEKFVSLFASDGGVLATEDPDTTYGELTNAVFFFPSPGSPFLEHVMSLFPVVYNGNLWGSVGPLLFRMAYSGHCGKSSLDNDDRSVNCTSLSILPPNATCALRWTDARLLLEDAKAVSAMDFWAKLTARSGGSYMLHLYGSFTFKWDCSEHSFFSWMRKRVCPLVAARLMDTPFAQSL